MDVHGWGDGITAEHGISGAQIHGRRGLGHRRRVVRIAQPLGPLGQDPSVPGRRTRSAINQNRRAVAFRGQSGEFADRVQQGYPFASAPLLASLRDGAPFVHISDVAERDDSISQLSTASGNRTILAVPLRKDDALLGMIVAGRKEVRPFTDKQIGLLRNFAAQAVIAMEIVIGNPPFLGDRRMIGTLGERYVKALRSAYADRIPGRSDLVCYWFAKGVDAIEKGGAERIGLVATNSISGGNNLPTLNRVANHATIFEAWQDQPWIVEGAAVRVAIVCFAGNGTSGPFRLDGLPTVAISPDLTSGLSLMGVLPLESNKGKSFVGTQKNGPFDISGELARRWLLSPINPNGRANGEVVRPWTNGSGLVRGDEDRWIIDFGSDMAERDAALYDEPFGYVVEHVRPTRLHLRRQWHRTKWWLHGDPRPALRRAIANKTRFLATPLVSKHRIFTWLPSCKIPENTVIVIARDDDTTFGVLQSRFHETWTLRLCTWLGVGNDPRYTPSTTFETFPFPAGLSPDIPALAYADDRRAVEIAAAAKRLNDLREAWLNPADLVERVPEVVPSFPDRIVPVSPKAAEILKKRTLTNLYNEHQAWLDNANRDLNATVAAAYGWPADISDDDALGRLFELNRARAAAQATRPIRIPRPGPQRTLLLPIAGEKEPVVNHASVEADPPKKRERGGARTA